MIVTLTPNPSLDRTVELSMLEIGEVNRVTGVRIDAGGKGVNVVRALHVNGHDAHAVLPGAGASAVEFGDLLNEVSVPHSFVDLPGAIRINITVAEQDGRTTKINEPGRASSAADAEAMLTAFSELFSQASWIVGCGSLPPGLPPDTYATVVRRARKEGVKVAIDASGAPFAAAVAAAPDLIKPNLEECEELVGHALPTLGDVKKAAEDLVAGGIETVVVSLGRHGALAVDAKGATLASAVVDSPLSTVGAGDCLLAGLLAGLSTGMDRAEALANGVRWGSAAVALPGSAVPAPADVQAVSVTIHDNPDWNATTQE